MVRFKDRQKVPSLFARGDRHADSAPKSSLITRLKPFSFYPLVYVKTLFRIYSIYVNAIIADLA